MKPVTVHFLPTRLRYLLMPQLALAIQIAAIYGSARVPADLRGAGFIVSYLLLLAFVILNRRCLGILIIGIGLALNFMAIVANGGFMPLTPESATQSGLAQRIAAVNPGEVVPASKHILLDQASSNLWFLSDILPVKAPVGRVFSIGDTFIVIGAIVFLFQTILHLLRRRRKASAGSRTRADTLLSNESLSE